MTIVTVPVFPPIPDRRYDWQAYDGDTYDVCADPECGCQARNPVGHGATKEEAIRDLLGQIEDLGSLT